MKINFNLSVAFLLFFGTTCFAQFVGGGGTAPVKNDKESAGPWKNRGYIYGGPCIPMGTWKKAPVASATISDAYTNNTGFGAKTGFYLEMGGMYFLKKLKLPESMAFAFNFTYLNFSMNKFDWSSLGPNFEKANSKNFMFLSDKFGLQYSYQIVDKFFVDAYFNICPTMAFLGRVKTTGDVAEYHYSVVANWSGASPSLNSSTYATGFAFAFRKSIGFNIRYMPFTFGLDYLFGGIKQDVYSTILDNRNHSNDQEIITPTKFYANTLQIKLGFTF
ncbi:MAG: hypothetical protein PSX36_08750 [bacterium]|nr:hypothetical protein [bacterium]